MIIGDNTRAVMLLWGLLLTLIGAIYFFHDYPIFWTLLAIKGVLIVGFSLWSKGFTNDESMWPQELQRTTAPASPVSQQQSNAPVGATSEGEFVMLRALGYIWTPLAALAWFLTVLISGVIFLIPSTRAIILPYINESVFNLFLAFGNIFGITLVVLNGLSGRWGPESLRQWDLRATRWFGVVGMSIISFLVFVVGIGREGLPSGATTFLLAITAFAFYDYFVNQGEDWRSSVLRGQAQAIPRATQSGTTGAPRPLTGVLAPFVPLGLTRILVPNELVVIEVDAGGGYDYDLPNMNQARLTALAAEAVSSQAGQHPGPAAQAPAAAPATP